MNVYVIFLVSHTMREMMGVYSSFEKAQEAINIFKKNLSGTSNARLFIIEQEVQ